ncbi:2-C-methyl-D-erythritol 4-phosphate cytidylyltransferase [Leucothrix mucor]|uniref:2-C-methyl-D-erythritol 4-phosphate cytidylyltransferase n=1 Tax=Leucothrix mucor TaxID=45248 RepID=UPI0003B39C28|nr:2-C-methyl-D-erythritol 4-phosphate cytidylyltransferase [Leucothrix mucor]
MSASLSSVDESVWLVIPASGVGKRMAAECPKQYLKLHDKTILEHTISRFTQLPQLQGVLIVVSEADEYWPGLQATLKSTFPNILIISCFGGAERSDTVANGLRYLIQEQQIPPDSWVMVHDAARPCVRLGDIQSLLAIRDDSVVGGILATLVRDTMKRAEANTKQIKHTESRENLWHAQTPQLFRLAELRDALHQAELANAVITDEASAMEAVAKSVLLIEGSADNIKLTQPSDLGFINYLLTTKDFTE